MAVFVTTWDGQLCTELIDLVRVEDSTAEGLTTNLLTTLEKSQINLNNMVAFASDTCNSMFGEFNSVTQKLKNKLPNLLTVKFSCHSIHLCSSKAFATLPNQVKRREKRIGIKTLQLNS